MPTILSRDNVEICYKDWGPRDGPVVLLSHGWPGCADSWEHQAFFLAREGFRVIAHDRRGHGHSTQSCDGDDMDHYADDLSQVIGALDLNNVSMFGFSAGGGEVVRYVGRHGSKCVARIGLISTVTPLMLRTDANPEGSPMETFDQLRARSVADRSQLYRDLAEGPMFGFDRPGAARSQGVIDAFWLRGMMGGHKNLYGAIAAFSETDFSEDLRKIDRPTLIVHGEDDQVAPAAASAEATQRLAPHGELKIYPGAPHGLLETHREQLNRDMLAFLRA